MMLAFGVGAYATAIAYVIAIDWLFPGAMQDGSIATPPDHDLPASPSRLEYLSYALRGAFDHGVVTAAFFAISSLASFGAGGMAGLTLAIALLAKRIAMRHARNPRCLKCHYSLAGIDQDAGWATCPECARISPVSVSAAQSQLSLGRQYRALREQLQWSRLWRHATALSALAFGILFWLAICVFIWAFGENTSWDFFGRIWSLGSPRAPIFIPLVLMLPAIASGALAFHITRRLVNR